MKVNDRIKEVISWMIYWKEEATILEPWGAQKVVSESLDTPRSYMEVLD